jgi:hypothetical protein
MNTVKTVPYIFALNCLFNAACSLYQYSVYECMNMRH